MSRFHVQVPLRWADLDAFRHVNHAHTVTLLEQARVELVFHRASGHGAGTWSDGLLVVNLQVDYKRQIPYGGQSVRVSMWVDQLRAASFVLAYELRSGPSADDPVAATAHTRMAPFDVADNRLRRLSATERDFLDLWRDDPTDPDGGA